MHLDKYKTPPEGYNGPYGNIPAGTDNWMDEDGCSYDTAYDFMRIHLLKFCGCGSDAPMYYVRDGLRLLRYRDEAYLNVSFAEWEPLEVKTFGSRHCAEFFWHMVDNLGFTEHGGSTPGWLSPLGIEVLEDLEEIMAVAEAASEAREAARAAKDGATK